MVELAGLAPGPFGCMVLADLGADVVLVDRPGTTQPALLRRGRRVVTLDLKTPAGIDGLLSLADHADVLVEGYRPGVAERLGCGPDVCRRRNPRLVYARLTGWGQDGPLAARAGHDIDYLALAGALAPLQPEGERPHAPLNLLADFAGGGMVLAVGVLAALLERGRSGAGQVIDAAMVDGSALLTTFVHEFPAAGLLDGTAPFYDTYATAGGGFMAVGALEPPFYAELLAGLGLDGDDDLPAQHDPGGWPMLRQRIAARFAERTRDEWSLIFAGRDACVTPVLSPAEAPAHPHNRARGTFVEVGGEVRPAPAPRFSRTPAASPQPPVVADLDDVIAGWEA